MNIVRDINDIKLDNSIVILGKFDGFHLGHKYLLHTAAGLKKDGMDLVLFTFDILPGIILNNNSVKSLDPRSEKAVLNDPDCLKYVDYVIEFPFNRQTMSISARDFVKDILVGVLGARYIAAGADFRFGKDRLGDPQLLKDLGSVYGFDVLIVDKLTVDLEAFANHEPEEYADLVKDYPKTIKGKAGYVRFDVKGAKK